MTDQTFMNIIMAVLISAGVIAFLRYFLKDFPFLLPKRERYSYKDIILKGIRNKDIQRRALFTIVILLICHFGLYITLPGLSTWELNRFMKSMAHATGGQAFSLFGGYPSIRMSIFALGLMPFMSICMLLQFASIIIPSLRQLYKKEGEARLILLRYAIIGTVVLSIIQSYFIGLWMTNSSQFAGISIITINENLFRWLAIPTLTSGTMLLLFIAYLINRCGIGNGVAMVVFTGIVYRFISIVPQAKLLYENNYLSASSIVLFAILLFIISWAMFYVTSLYKRWEEKDTKQLSVNIFLRPSIAGIIPISLATTLFFFPVTISGFINNTSLHNFSNFLLKSPLVHIFQSIFILVFAFIYFKYLLWLIPIKDLLKKYGYPSNGIPDRTSLFKNSVFVMAMVTGGFLFLTTIIPGLVGKLLGLPYNISSLLSHGTLLIGVGIIYDLLKQAEARLLLSENTEKTWHKVYSAFDEYEAEIKRACLKDNGIECIIEPLRFTWGMPIRTPLDEYRLYVPAGGLGKARELLQR